MTDFDNDAWDATPFNGLRTSYCVRATAVPVVEGQVPMDAFNSTPSLLAVGDVGSEVSSMSSIASESLRSIKIEMKTLPCSCPDCRHGNSDRCIFRDITDSYRAVDVRFKPQPGPLPVHPSLELLMQHFGAEITGADCIIIGLKRRQGADGTWPEGNKFSLAIMNKSIFRCSKAEKIEVAGETDTFIHVNANTCLLRVSMLTAMDTEGLVYQSRSTKKHTVLADWVVFPTNIIDDGRTRSNYLNFEKSTKTLGRSTAQQYVITTEATCDMMNSSTRNDL